jgi:actin-related protein 3
MIQFCPIDTRRNLYKNIVLSGGSTLFDGLCERIQSSLQARVDKRLKRFESEGKKPTPIEVNVDLNSFKRYSVWQGGSILASEDRF